jgi:hypothetical protein
VRDQIRFWCPRASSFNSCCCIRVAGDRPVVVTVRSNDVGQHPGVERVRLRPGQRVTIAIAVGAARVDGEDLVASGDEGLDDQPSVGLDPDLHLARLLGVHGDELMKLGHAGDPVLDASRDQLPAVVAADVDVVMIFRPVESYKDHVLPSLLQDRGSERARAVSRRPNGEVLNGTPSQDLTSRELPHSLSLPDACDGSH